MVKVVSTATGNLVAKISVSATGTASDDKFSGHIYVAAPLACNPFQLITASRDGFIRIWDLTDASLLVAIDIMLPVYQMCTHKCLNDCVIIATPAHEGNGRTFSYHLILTVCAHFTFMYLNGRTSENDSDLKTVVTFM